VVLLVVMVEPEAVAVLQEQLLKTGSLSVAFLWSFLFRESIFCTSFHASMCIVLSGLSHSILCLRNSIRNNLNGQFLTLSCESLLGLQLLKSCCLPIDHLSNDLGLFSFWFISNVIMSFLSRELKYVHQT